MAYENSNAALPASAHPMAKPGYGKRSAPDQEPSQKRDFGHLPAREVYLAAFVDRLPEGAAMDAKTLANAQPLYGQQAVRTALNELSRTGHLRRVRRLVQGEGDAGTGTRWVFRTYWSRTARDSEWWNELLGGDTGGGTPTATGVQGGAPDDVPERRHQPESSPPPPSPAYSVLAQLGRATPDLILSAADCAALEGLAADWLARGVTADHLTRALTTGLPDQVYAPRAFLQRRLLDKMPPVPPPSAPRTLRTIMECTGCGVPGRPEALPGGLCRACRAPEGTGDPGSRRRPVPTTPEPADAHRHATQVRRALAGLNGRRRG
ncbi:hypothetical protein [Streptomyces lasiicapitis]|uniref:hypothetical protein n=1 Tax=Streptomyces lasiicapitis TaxID=1923961 RepID=UPI003648EE7E